MDLVCEYFDQPDCQFTLILVVQKILGNLLALAGVCPFVGSLSDLIGRRYVAILGASLICLGMIVSSTANTMNTFIG